MLHVNRLDLSLIGIWELVKNLLSRVTLLNIYIFSNFAGKENGIEEKSYGRMTSFNIR